MDSAEAKALIAKHTVIEPIEFTQRLMAAVKPTACAAPSMCFALVTVHRDGCVGRSLEQRVRVLAHYGGKHDTSLKRSETTTGIDCAPSRMRATAVVRGRPDDRGDADPAFPDSCGAS